MRLRFKKFKFGYPDSWCYDVTSCAARVTFMTFIDPDRGHVTSRGRSLFAMSQEPGIRDLRVRVKNSVIQISGVMTSLPVLRNDLYDLDGGHAAHAATYRTSRGRSLFQHISTA